MFSMFRKKKKVIDLGEARIIEEPTFDNPEEERLSRNYAYAKMAYECLWHANTAGLSHMQRATQTLEYKKAHEQFNKAELELTKYAEKKYA